MSLFLGVNKFCNLRFLVHFSPLYPNIKHKLKKQIKEQAKKAVNNLGHPRAVLTQIHRNTNILQSTAITTRRERNQKHELFTRFAISS